MKIPSLCKTRVTLARAIMVVGSIVLQAVSCVPGSMGSICVPRFWPWWGYKGNISSLILLSLSFHVLFRVQTNYCIFWSDGEKCSDENTLGKMTETVVSFSLNSSSFSDFIPSALGPHHCQHFSHAAAFRTTFITYLNPCSVNDVFQQALRSEKPEVLQFAKESEKGFHKIRFTSLLMPIWTHTFFECSFSNSYPIVTFALIFELQKQ